MANATIASVGALIAAAAAAAGTAATTAAANASTVAAAATAAGADAAAAAITVATAAGDGVLHIVTAHRPPLVNIRNNGTAFSGMLIDMLPRLLDNAGIKNPYKLYQLTSQGGGGSLRPNGTWSGVMGQLTTGPADMALFPLTLTAQRSQYISATVPFLDSGYALLVKVVQQDHAYSFVVPFKTSTWLLILASLVAVILFVSLLDTWTRKARYRALERLHGLDRAKLRRKRERAMQHATESIFMLIGQGSSPSSHSWGVKVLFICWAVFSVILLSAYTANLTANLTVSRLGSTIKTLAELKKAGSFFGVPADSSVLRYFRDSSDGLAASLLPMVIEYKSPAEGVAAVRDGKIAAFATDFPVLKGFAQEPPCDLAVSDETFGPGQLVIGLRPNSTLQTPLDRGLLKLADEGVLSDLRRKWFTEMSACAAVDAADHSDAQSLTPSNVAPVFYLLVGGVVFAVLWAAAEVLFYRFAYDKVTQIRRNGSASVRGTLDRLRSMRPPSRASNGSMRGGGTPDLPISSRDDDRNLHKRGGGGGGKSRNVQILRSDTLSENLTQSTVSSDSDASDDLSSDHWRHRVAEEGGAGGGNATDTTDASVDADAAAAGGFVDLPDAPRGGRDAGMSAFEAAAERAVAAAARRERREQRERERAEAGERGEPRGEGRQRVVSFAEPSPPPAGADADAAGAAAGGEGASGAGEIAVGDGGPPSDGWRPVDGRWQPAGDGWRAPQQFRGSQPRPL